MDNVCSINTVDNDPFVVTWDLGPRCNYDCSYCPSHRHDNYSKHATLDELVVGSQFVFDYCQTLLEHKKGKKVHIDFTGGEPTVNPQFIEFGEYLRQKHKSDYANNFDLWLAVTTNGAMSRKIADSIIANFDYATVSYHCEADGKLKQQVLDRIQQFHASGFAFKVNVMFHAEHFDECRALCDGFKLMGVKYIPRKIGDDPASASSRAHNYTDEQKAWFNSHWNTNTGQGRPCCGGRSMSTTTESGDTQVVKFLNNRQFENWHCSVNWSFLHLEQQNDLVFHHQTCQAKFDGTRGAIGTISGGSDIVVDLKQKLNSGTMPIIVCPNKYCGCGLCAPKSMNRDTLITMLGYSMNNKLFG
jgi:MoaA/NifB/PqqE/SkfB family radical SAM enzyme